MIIIPILQMKHTGKVEVPRSHSWEVAEYPSGTQTLTLQYIVLHLPFPVLPTSLSLALHPPFPGFLLFPFSDWPRLSP